mmetsp:Transcript_16976/g.27568  ORF Transcript_16976/g.27568 Transcript_16976/m.27568 type:complete len:96 (-) Transcript_16976:503-790(-)
MQVMNYDILSGPFSLVNTALSIQKIYNSSQLRLLGYNADVVSTYDFIYYLIERQTFSIGWNLPLNACLLSLKDVLPSFFSSERSVPIFVHPNSDQ